MKKVLFMAAVAAFTMTSCKKDFTCECTDGTVSLTYTFLESKKSAAAALCEGKGIGGIDYNNDGTDDTTGDDTYTCTLK